MANTITVALGKIFAMGLLALREQASVLMAVNRDFSNEVAQKGDTIDVVIPSAIPVDDVTPSNVMPAGTDVAPTKVQIPLNNWKKAEMHLTDKEIAEIANYPPGLKNQQVSEAVKSLVNKVAADLYGQYKGIYGYVGTAGTTPFGSGVEAASATQLRKTLNVQLAPLEPRFAIVDPDAEAAALNIRAFQDASFAGTVEGIRDGQIGRKLGFAWLMDQLIPSHDTEAAGTILTDQADIEVGDTTVHFDGVTTEPAVGDVFTVAGDTQTYVVTAVGTLAGTDIDLTFQPPAKVAWADSAAVTFKADHVVNLGFHRDAFALAIRPLGTPDGFTGGNMIMSAQDPVTGIPLRLEVSRQYKRNLYTWDILYGVKLVRPELAARLAG